MNYTEAKTLLSRGRNGRRKVGNNTYLHAVDDGIAVQLHATNVVIIHPDNTYTLNTGGWYTVTTKARINDFSPARVYSDKGIWYVDDVPFQNNMKVDSNGKPTEPITDATNYAANKRRLDRMVSTYISGFSYHCFENGLQPPSGGDCWGCHFTSETSNDPMGLDHLLQHMEENYYVPSLLWNAICQRGYSNPSLIWHTIERDLETRSDTKLMRDILRGYFRKRKIALLEIMMSQVA